MNDALIVDPSPANIRRAAECLRAGDLVGIPTETVYGLAADAMSEDAIAKVFAAKGRPATNPLIVHVHDSVAAERLIDFDGHDWLPGMFRVAKGFWPGPLTIVVPRAPLIPDAVTAGLDTVAIRVPSHPVTQAILRECGIPIAAPSANVSNYVSPTAARHVASGLRDRIAMVVDGGECDVGIESTIIRLEEAGPRLLRPGGVSAEELRRDFGSLLVKRAGKGDSQESMPAPGMFPKHYSPRKPLSFAKDLKPIDGQSIGHIAFKPSTREANRVWLLSETGDLHEIAKKMFANLREADDSECDVLIIDECEEVGVGVAIMDRLRRAVTK